MTYRVFRTFRCAGGGRLMPRSRDETTSSPVNNLITINDERIKNYLASVSAGCDAQDLSPFEDGTFDLMFSGMTDHIPDDVKALRTATESCGPAVLLLTRCRGERRSYQIWSSAFERTPFSTHSRSGRALLGDTNRK